MTQPAHHGERGAPSAPASRVATTAVEGLGPEIAAFLACLWQQPGNLAELALTTLPHGSLMQLIAADVIKPVPAVSASGFVIVVTDHGHKVIRRCAERLPDCQRAGRQDAARAELRRARDARAATPDIADAPPGTAVETRRRQPVIAWVEDNAGLVSVVGIVIGVIVAVLIAFVG